MVPPSIPHARGNAYNSSIPPHALTDTLLIPPDHIIWTPPLIPSEPTHDHIYFDNLRLETSPHDNDEDFSEIKTPYSAVQFKIFLENTGLLDRYPELCFKLTHGFPLSEFEPLLESYYPPNLPSTDLYCEIIRTYINDEIKLGRFMGPFTREELESKIGFFRSSPLQVAVTGGDNGDLLKHHICRNLSYKGKIGRSVNNEINSKDYPTQWYKATDVAKIVHLKSLSISIFTMDLSFRSSNLSSSTHSPHIIL